MFVVNLLNDNFRPLEVVGCNSETPLDGGGILILDWALKGL